MKQWMRAVLSLVFYGVSGLGISLSIKAAVGVSSFYAMNVAISQAAGISIGVVTIAINTAFLLLYMALTRFAFPVKYITQWIAVVCLGKVTDFFLCGVLGSLSIHSYAANVALLVAGTVLGGFSVGMVLNLQAIAFPVESACAQIAERKGIAFAKVRYGVDVFSVAVSLLLTALCGLPLFVREGTLISMLLLTAVISLTKKTYESFLKSKAESDAVQRL